METEFRPASPIPPPEGRLLLPAEEVEGLTEVVTDSGRCCCCCDCCWDDARDCWEDDRDCWEDLAESTPGTVVGRGNPGGWDKIF